MTEDYTKLTNDLQAKEETTVNTIKRVDISTLTPETFFEQFQKIGSPVIITGLLKECDWNIEYYN